MMLCYRDRTFCAHYSRCIDGVKCESALTPEVKAASEQENLPVAVFFDKPTCFRAKSQPDVATDRI